MKAGFHPIASCPATSYTTTKNNPNDKRKEAGPLDADNLLRKQTTGGRSDRTNNKFTKQSKQTKRKLQ